MTWEFDAEAPTSPGHYAIQYCWDTEEGSFCGVDYWDGKEWADYLPIIGRSSEAFPTKEDAEKWVEANDVSW